MTGSEIQLPFGGPLVVMDGGSDVVTATAPVATSLPRGIALGASEGVLAIEVSDGRLVVRVQRSLLSEDGLRLTDEGRDAYMRAMRRVRMLARSLGEVVGAVG